MQQVARQVAVAVDNALNYESSRAYEEQLSRERDRLRTLLEINNAVVSCLASKPLFHAISASLRRTFGLDYASLLIYDPEIRALRLHMLDFPEGSGLIHEDMVVPVDDSLGRLRLPHPPGPRSSASRKPAPSPRPPATSWAARA